LAIIENTVTYTDGDVVLEAFFAFDDSVSDRKPAVLVCHTWVGRNNFVANKARALAELGYVGFALDMYGKGILGISNEENSKLMQPFMDDRALVQKRMTLALDTVKKLPWVDDGKVAAIGYCFGGLCALDLARTGIDLQGVVSFHGLLDAPTNNMQSNKIKAQILALHGHDDPMGLPEQVLSFQVEMTQAGADWQFVTYGNTVHAFTNPAANDPSSGLVYKADADRRSWQAMKNFLVEIFN
jgi:dienelactone hydrolase